MKPKRTPIGHALDVMVAKMWRKQIDPIHPKAPARYPKWTELHFNAQIGKRSIPFKLRLQPCKP